MAHIVSIAYTPEGVEQHPADHYARVALEHASLVEGRGILGDTKGKGGKRQLNIMRAETVAQLKAEGYRAAPGELGEQLVLAGLESGTLTLGARLHLGSTAIIEVTKARTPCGRFAHIQGRPQEAAEGRIGVMARVLTGGDIAVGDAVRVEAASS
jgi:MOSC domain-containing protein YiiM